jgi:hypothetical protein
MPRSRSVALWAFVALGVLLVGVVVVLTTRDGEDTSSRAERGSAVTVGQPVVLHGVRYEVTGVRTARRLFAVEKPTEFDEPRQTRGTFVAVDVVLRNDAGEPASASFHGSSFVGGDGKAHPLDALSWGTYYDLQPDLAERARLVFDVRPVVTRGATLVLADCPLDAAGEPDDCATARVDLGLR